MKKTKAIVFLLFTFFSSLVFCAENSEKPDKPSRYEPVLFESLKPKLGRALIESGITYLTSSINYWSKYASFIADWQYTLTWKDQKRRFFTGEAIRFDSNNFYLNWGHGLAGMTYFDYFRCNRLSAAASAIWASVFGIGWEYVTEWREIISINDVIFTCIGGAPLGETLFQVSRYFASHSGWGSRFLQTACNEVSAFNDILDGRFRRRAAYTPIPGNYQFRFMLGLKDSPVSSGGRNRSQSDVGLDFLMMPIPEYGQVGSFSEFKRRTMSVHFHFDIASSRVGVEEYRFGTRVIWAGYFTQELAADKNGRPRGWQLIAGFGSGYDFYRRRSVVYYDSNDNGSKDPRYAVPRPTDFRDKMAEVNMAGPVCRYTLFRPKWQLSATAEAYLDFGMVNAFALNQYSIDHETQFGKTTVMAWGYYYGLGCTLRGGLEFTSGQLSLSSELSWQRYGSIEGNDRFADQVTGDFHISDRRTLFTVEAALKIPRLPLQLAAVYEDIARWGRIRPVVVRGREGRFFYRIILVL